MSLDKPDNEMPELLKDLDPVLLWFYFNLIRQIPRESGNEKHILAYLVNWASERGYICRTDEAGNICIKVPGTSKTTDAKTVILHVHADMVCEAEPSKQFNFATDAIQLKKEGQFIKADGTTLGADNGIGLAAIMAIVSDSESNYPPLEILVTVDEERTFSGALNVDPIALGLTGRTLLNLDNEDLGTLIVASAGMQTVNGSIETVRDLERGSNGRYFKLSLTGFPGGHSGEYIHEKRDNPIKILAQFLTDLGENAFQLVSIDGGQRDSSIPTNAEAVIKLNYPTPEILEKLRSMNATEIFEQPACLTKDFKERILSVINKSPHGVVAKEESDGSVKTSANMAVVHTFEDRIVTIHSVRSAVDTARDAVVEEIERLLDYNGFEIESEPEIPAWEGDPNSLAVQVAIQAYKVVLKKAPRIARAHFALEPGALEQRFKARNLKVNSVSFGPNIYEAHSVNERVDIESVEVFYQLLKKILAYLDSYKK